MNKETDLLKYERALYDEGITLVAGVDEVGRGPLAGPVVAAAVILPVEEKLAAVLAGVNDSKTLTPKKRAAYYKLILTTAKGIGIGMASVAEIDEMNILKATKLAMQRAISELAVKPKHLLIDFLTLDLPIDQQGIVKGDANSLSIAAASIVAKEYRDDLMKRLGEKYPEYGFGSNSGYGTKAHREALEKYGYVKGVHRLTFEPVKTMVAQDLQGKLF